MRWLIALLMLGFLVPNAVPQSAPQSTPTATAVCTFEDGNEMSVRYPNLPVGKQELRNGEIWPSGNNSQIFLFTTTDVLLGNSVIPRGAFSVYLLPGKEKWTLVINKSVSGSSYQQTQDLARQPLEIGQLSQPEKFEVAFAPVGAKQCNMRIYHGKTGAWAQFKEK